QFVQPRKHRPRIIQQISSNQRIVKDLPKRTTREMMRTKNLESDANLLSNEFGDFWFGVLDLGKSNHDRVIRIDFQLCRHSNSNTIRNECRSGEFQNLL